MKDNAEDLFKKSKDAIEGFYLLNEEQLALQKYLQGISKEHEKAGKLIAKVVSEDNQDDVSNINDLLSKQFMESLKSFGFGKRGRKNSKKAKKSKRSKKNTRKHRRSRK